MLTLLRTAKPINCCRLHCCLGISTALHQSERRKHLNTLKGGQQDRVFLSAVSFPLYLTSVSVDLGISWCAYSIFIDFFPSFHSIPVKAFNEVNGGQNVLFSDLIHYCILPVSGRLHSLVMGFQDRLQKRGPLYKRVVNLGTPFIFFNGK